MLNNTKIALFIRKLKTFQTIAQSQRFDPKNCRFEGLNLVVSNLASFYQNSNFIFSKPKIIFQNFGTPKYRISVQVRTVIIII